MGFSTRICPVFSFPASVENNRGFYEAICASIFGLFMVASPTRRDRGSLPFEQDSPKEDIEDPAVVVRRDLH